LIGTDAWSTGVDRSLTSLCVPRPLPPITGCVKAIGQLFKLTCCMAFFAAGAVAGGYEAAVLWTMSTGFFLLALGY
jgi:hypothetical protein